MAIGYDSDGKIAPLIDFGWDAPSGQMYSTINDLLKVYTFIDWITESWHSLCILLEVIKNVYSIIFMHVQMIQLLSKVGKST